MRKLRLEVCVDMIPAALCLCEHACCVNMHAEGVQRPQCIPFQKQILVACAQPRQKIQRTNISQLRNASNLQQDVAALHICADMDISS